jgi:hypothetical protein
MSDPPSRRFPYVVFGALGIAAVTIVVLWGYPGVLATGPQCPTHVSADGQWYCAEAVEVTPQVAGFPGYGGVRWYCPGATEFQGVTFGMCLSPAVGIGGAPSIQGWYSAASSPLDRFDLIGNPYGPATANWTSADGDAIVEWASPFSSPDSPNSAVVTVGVDLGTNLG